MKLEIRIDQVVKELDTLASFSDTVAPAVTRVVFSPADQRAREWWRAQCAEAGLSLREDAVGNAFARWEGSSPELPAVGTGSHIDAIPHSGRYDGTVGVLGGLEAVRALQRAGVRPRRSIEVLLFTSEEPTRFGIGCLGSRLLCGGLSLDQASAMRDREGASLDEVRTAAGFSGDLSSVALPDNYYHAFLELHIEQGPRLEKSGIPLGVVTAIAAPATLRFEIEGEGGHAGAVLMPDRRDAFLAAAEIALAVEAAAKGTGAIDTVGTVGYCEVFPGAVNSIPSKVSMLADVRDIEHARRDEVLATITARANEITATRRVGLRTQLLNADAPATCSPMVIDALRAACEDSGLAYEPMVSRAYHDSLFMSRVAPAGMLFIPCRNGISHTPDEYAAPDDIERGIRVLATALSRLAT